MQPLAQPVLAADRSVDGTERAQLWKLKLKLGRPIAEELAIATLGFGRRARAGLRPELPVIGALAHWPNWVQKAPKMRVESTKPSTMFTATPAVKA